MMVLCFRFLKKYNVKTIGVDPTDAIDDAINLDLKIKDYFSSGTVEKINEKFNKVDVITFTNVFAHIEDLKSLLENLKKIISDETLIIIENHYLGSIINQINLILFTMNILERIVLSHSALFLSS